MADNKIVEREYTIPLRRFWFGARTYERTSRAVKAIKQFIAKHMKVEDRDIDKVKLDVLFNNEVWFRGRATPPSKVRVKATKDGDIVRVTFAETPDHIKFARAKHERKHKAAEKAPAPVQEKKEEKTEDQKKDEQEKEKASAVAKEAEIKQENKAAQKATKVEKAVHPQRMALKK